MRRTDTEVVDRALRDIRQAQIDEMRDLLRAVLRCEDVHTDRKWMRRAKKAVGE